MIVRGRRHNRACDRQNCGDLACRSYEHVRCLDCMPLARGGLERIIGRVDQVTGEITREG